MVRVSKSTYNFYTCFLEDKYQLPKIFKSIKCSDTRKVVYSNEVPRAILRGPYFYHITHVPDYLKAEIKESPSLMAKKRHMVKGYGIDLNDINSVDSYLRKNYKRGFKNIKRSMNRLESSYPISYQWYFGNGIKRTDYHLLMDALYSMIKKRFEERREESKQLTDWSLTVEKTYELILKKRASIFVIYENKKPLNISINYHRDSIFYSAISSYDINYSKFGLGHIDIFKQIEWCINNRYSFFDFGWGEMEYKHNWSNKAYDFEQYIVYDQRWLFIRILAKMLEIKVKVKNYLISKKIHVVVKNIKKWILITFFPVSRPEIYRFFDIQQHYLESELEPLDLNNTNKSFNRRILNDFLYLYKEHINNVKVFKIRHCKNQYIIMGSDNKKLCSITH